MHKGEWPHMAEYHALFLFGKFEIPFRIFTRDLRMMISVETISFDVPVIEKIVMKQGGFDKAFFSGTYMKSSVYEKSRISYTQAMIIGAFISVLNVFTHALKPDITRDRLGNSCEILKFSS